MRANGVRLATQPCSCLPSVLSVNHHPPSYGAAQGYGAAQDAAQGYGAAQGAAR